jgi:hypothetical protein
MIVMMFAICFSFSNQEPKLCDLVRYSLDVVSSEYYNNNSTSGDLSSWPDPLYSEIMVDRTYRKKERALREAETRQRITEAAVELHGTVGPAHTGVADVAKLAGVSRMTVYNHFPTEVDIFTACSTHWAMTNPFPDPSDWRQIEEPAGRLAVGLKELYRWYGLKDGMLGNVLRDTPTMPALASVMENLWVPYMGEVVGALALGWRPERGKAKELKAGLRVAVDFGTWKILTESGLNSSRAARVAAGMVISGFSE